MISKIKDICFAILLIVLTVVVFYQYKSNEELKGEINNQYLITMKTLEKNTFDLNKYITNKKISALDLVGFKSRFIEYKYSSGRISGILNIDPYVENIIMNVDNFIAGDKKNSIKEIKYAKDNILRDTNILLESFKLLNAKAILNTDVYSILNKPNNFFNKYLGDNLKLIN